MEMDFPYARCVVAVRSSRTLKRDGSSTRETRYYLSSQDPAEHTPESWHALIRGHWAGVENRNHWRRDALFGEDRSRSRNPSLLANLALIRSALLRLLPKHFPGDSVPVIRERLQGHPHRALAAVSS